MKKLLCAFALSLLLSPFAPRAKSQDVSIDFFYDNINGGSWIEVGNYGYCWQPEAASDPSWRPYADGYWAYTDEGWTWVSYEPFGWATYHYGRWVRLADYGWVWRPGYEWGPAWVSWRFGGGYCGWAPLPPETEVVYESRPLTGHLDVEFDIGPAYYNFVDVRYIGEPVLRSRIIEVNQNVTYINQTVNVTNITYKNKTVYNYGPDLNTVNQFSSRPIQKLKLERQTNVDVAAAAKSGGLMKVQGNSLMVGAPTTIKKSATQIAPPMVKSRVANVKVEKGWSVAGDANAQAQLKEKIKTQDLKKIPPTTIGANAAAGASGSVAPGGFPAAATSPFEKGKGKGKGKQAEQFQAGAGASASPGGAMTSPVMSPEFGKKGKGKNKGAEQFQPGPATSPMTSPAAEASSNAPSEYGKHGKGKGREQFGAPATTPAPTTGAEGMGKPEGKRKGMQSVAPSSGGPANPPENFNEPRGKHKQIEQPPSETSPSGQNATGPQGGPYGEGRGKHKQIEQPPSAMSPSGQSAAGPQGGPYGESRGKQKAEEVKVPPQVGETGAAKHEGQGKGKGQGAATATPGPQ